MSKATFIAEYARLLLCISYWESRKMRGPLGVFFIFHNLGCQMRADGYRDKVKKIMPKMKAKP